MANPWLSSPYTSDQIKGYVDQQGIGNDPMAMYKAAQQNGVGGAQLSKAMGWAGGTADGWVAQQGLAPLTGFKPGEVPWLDQQQTDGGGQAQATQGNPYTGGVYGQNPFTGQQADAMRQTVGDMLTRQALPAINNNAVASGGVGGSRQGLAQGMAIGDAAKGLASGLGNLYSTNYANDQQFGLASDRLNLDINNSNQNWMRQGAQDQIGLMNQAMNWQNNGTQAATAIQNTPLNYWQQFLNGNTQAGGLGGTNSQTLQGNPFLGAIAGYQLGQKVGG